ncbi:hypothetical protein [[Mycobacterium] zoologicum]|uniref:hypothetical protein n=1 Tax=[Mycobacterium] zoologicum TaxID=2872311 RepID=UPI001CDAFF83|nr:hypothetical protein [Mycolicibacter sp. MYC101]MEB3062477.1 hypothetical protein [Mycolicibacter sp. MYC101]
MDAPDECSFAVDWRRSACLRERTDSDIDHHAVMVVGPEGTEHALLIDVSIVGAYPVNFGCPDAPHEQLGSLPDTYAHRLRPP